MFLTLAPQCESWQHCTEAAGRSLVSIIVDHIFLCVKDAGKYPCQMVFDPKFGCRFFLRSKFNSIFLFLLWTFYWWQWSCFADFQLECLMQSLFFSRVILYIHDFSSVFRSPCRRDSDLFTRVINDVFCI